MTQITSTKSYYHAPELGLNGIWKVEERMLGLELLMSVASGSVLDVGCAEGLLSAQFAALGGVTWVDGVEGCREHHAAALRLWSHVPKLAFHFGDVRVPGQYITRLFINYDVILFLGVYHKLGDEADLTLGMLLSMCSKFFAIRCPTIPKDFIVSRGFRNCYHLPADGESGELAVYERITS